MTSVADRKLAARHLDVLYPSHFAYRHIGPRRADVDEMLELLGYDSLDSLHRRRGAGGDPAAPPAGTSARTERAGGAAGAPGPGRDEPGVPLLHRHGIRRLLHPAR